MVGKYVRRLRQANRQLPRGEQGRKIRRAGRFRHGRSAGRNAAEEWSGGARPEASRHAQGIESGRRVAATASPNLAELGVRTRGSRPERSALHLRSVRSWANGKHRERYLLFSQGRKRRQPLSERLLRVHHQARYRCGRRNRLLSTPASVSLAPAQVARCRHGYVSLRRSETLGGRRLREKGGRTDLRCGLPQDRHRPQAYRERARAAQRPEQSREISRSGPAALTTTAAALIDI